MKTARMKFFIRVTNVGIFNLLVEAAEEKAHAHHAELKPRRSRGYYELRTSSADLWQALYLYGQVLAQAQDDYIDGGEELTL